MFLSEGAVNPEDAILSGLAGAAANTAGFTNTPQLHLR